MPSPALRLICGPAIFYFLLFSLACSGPGKPQAYKAPAYTNLYDSIPTSPDNPLTIEGVELGRILFYDPILSANGKVSCATCHNQQLAFSDGLPNGGLGISGKLNPRNAPALMNLAFSKGLFWDGGVKNPESFSFAPIQHPDEMGSNLKELITRLNCSANYPALFRNAFGSDSIDSQQLSRALAQFMRSMVSGNSRYDRFIRREKGNKLTKFELQGYFLFNQNCSQCHSGELFTDNDYHNIGLQTRNTGLERDLTETGRFRITLDSADFGKFKTPSLRNITLTSPYMHDGRFKTLEEVFNQYRFHTADSPLLDGQLRNRDGSVNMHLSDEEQSAIIAFLQTLTDSTFISNQNYAAPVAP
ncbi:MAG: cytochrome c peroxidase [Bacteroidota bacterium]